MPLDFQPIAIPIAGGRDAKVDPKVAPAGVIRALENAVRDRAGEVVKRKGHEALSDSINGGGTIATGLGLGAFGGELLQVGRPTATDEAKLYTWGGAISKWNARQFISDVKVETAPVAISVDDRDHVDAAVANNIGLYAWEDSGSGGVKAMAIDENTGATVIGVTSISVLGTRPKCVAIGQYLFVVWIETGGGTVKTKRLDSLSPTALGSTVTVASDLITTVEARMQVAVTSSARASTHAVIAWTTSPGGTPKIKVGLMKTDGTLETSPAAVEIAAAAPDSLSISVGEIGADARIVVAFGFEGTAELRYFVLDELDLSTEVASTNISATTTENVCTVWDPSGSQWHVFYEKGATDNWNHVVAHRTISAAFAVSGEAELMKSVMLASYPWHDATLNRTMVAVVHNTDLQGSYFITDTESRTATPRVYARVLYGRGATPYFGDLAGANRGHVPHVSALGSQRYLVPCLMRTSIDNRDAVEGSFLGDIGTTGIAKAIVDLSGRKYLFAEFSGGCYIAGGGDLVVYDGAYALEAGFYLFPENATMAVAAGGSLSAGDYQARVVYEMNLNGRLLRSAHGVVKNGSSTKITAAANDKLTVTIPTLRIASLPANVSAVLYSTKANGDRFYRSGELSKAAASSPATDTPVINVTTANTVQIVRTESDATIEAHEPLYTDSEAENVLPPSPSAMAVWQDRLVLAGLEGASSSLWFSKPEGTGLAVEFSDLFEKALPADGGAITAIAAMNEKLLVFKKTRTYMLMGAGPDRAGYGDFAPPRLVSADVGCSNASSVIATPEGVYFESERGVYLITAALETIYVGAPVEDKNALTITGAVILPDQHRFLWATSDGDALVWDSFFRQWATWTGLAAVGAAVWDGKHVLLKSDGAVWKASTSLYQDAGADYTFKVQLAWLVFSAFQRVRRYEIVGEKVANCTIRVREAVDYDDTVVDTSTFDLSLLAASEPMKFRKHINSPYQKSEALSLIIDDAGAANPGGAFKLSKVLFEVGVKKGIGRLSSARTVA